MAKTTDMQGTTEQLCEVISVWHHTLRSGSAGAWSAETLLDTLLDLLLTMIQMRADAHQVTCESNR